MINTVMLTLILFEYCFFSVFFPSFFSAVKSGAGLEKKEREMKIWKPALGFFSLYVAPFLHLQGLLCLTVGRFPGCKSTTKIKTNVL